MGLFILFHNGRWDRVGGEGSDSRVNRRRQQVLLERSGTDIQLSKLKFKLKPSTPYTAHMHP